MNWINIKNKKPEIGQRVIGYYKGIKHDKSIYKGFVIVYYLINWYDRRKKCFSEKIWYYNIYGRENWPVTHWMPLPDIPKE